MTLARRGLNLLLNEYPDADVVHVSNQNWRSDYQGPWTCVTLKHEGYANVAEYAIWNHTGAVYRTDNHGAVADDPFIVPRDSPYRDDSGWCTHKWGPWENDVAGVIRKCTECKATEFRPEG